MAGPTRRPFLKALACAGVVYVIGAVALFTSLDTPAAPENAGRAMGRLLFLVLLPAVITGLLARYSSKVWPLWRIIVTFLAILVVVVVLNVVGMRPR